MLGGSDAGAHLDRMCGAPYPTAFLADCIRGRRLVPVEEAVRLMTSVPAEVFGLVDRGTIAEGMIADLMVFDPETVGAGPVRMTDDLPGDNKRLVADAIGVKHVFVGRRRDRHRRCRDRCPPGHAAEVGRRHGDRRGPGRPVAGSGPRTDRERATARRSGWSGDPSWSWWSSASRTGRSWSSSADSWSSSADRGRRRGTRSSSWMSSQGRWWSSSSGGPPGSSADARRRCPRPLVTVNRLDPVVRSDRDDDA